METTDFEKLFSTLTPIKTSGDRDVKTSRKPLFMVTVTDSGEPFITVLDNDISRMSAIDRRIYDEIQNLTSSASDIFGIGGLRSSVKETVSLWDNPYIVRLLSRSRSVVGKNRKPVTFSEDPAYPLLRLDLPAKEQKADASIVLRAAEKESADFTFLDDTHVLCDEKVFTVETVGANYPHIRKLVEPVPREMLESFLTLFLTFTENIVPELNGVRARTDKTPEHAVPTLFLEKVAADKALYLRVGISLESLGSGIPAGMEVTRTASVSTGGTITIRTVEECDVSGHADELEKMILSSAPDRHARKEVYREGGFFIIPEATAGPFLLRCLPQVLEDFRLVGSEKLKEYKIVAAVPKVNLRLSSGIDFLEGDGEVTVGDEKFSIADLLKRLNHKRYVQLSDGNRAILDENYINRLQRLFRRRDKEGRIRVTLFDLPEVEELIQKKITGDFASHARKTLQGFNSLAIEKTPGYKVNATLRPYQIEGVKWLKYLYDNKLGGCLADDMGLGKTLQTIALLSMVYPGAKLPSLIVMPRSLLFNWEKELDRFAPQLTHSTYYGSDRKLDEVLKSDIILTTYAVMRNDIMMLKEHEFQCVVLDESQNIKTYTAQTTVAVQLLRSDHRLALSGTPMENNLTEIYSLFRFLNPTMFGTVEDFNASYTYPIQKSGDKDATISLRRRIFPFILRRLKRDVLSDLPERIDQTIYVEMSAEQKSLYNERRMMFRDEINRKIATEGLHKSRFALFQALSELRRIASVPEALSDGKVSSPKIDELLESVESAVSNGHKTVVFFNFLAGLEIVMSRLDALGIGFETMTGSTSASGRKRIVERFQSDPQCMVMLLTLKVGGVGLNLTAADTVYIFEPWWNKAAEEQAINRLHRIGQKSVVSSFSLITVGTIEEKILQLQQQKSDLIDELISADGTGAKQLTQQDIDFILS